MQHAVQSWSRTAVNIRHSCYLQNHLQCANLQQTYTDLLHFLTTAPRTNLSIKHTLYLLASSVSSFQTSHKNCSSFYFFLFPQSCCSFTLMLPGEQFPRKIKLYPALILQDLLNTLLCSGGLLFSQLPTGFKIPSLPTPVHTDHKIYHLLHYCSNMVFLSFCSTATSWRHWFSHARDQVWNWDAEILHTQQSNNTDTCCKYACTTQMRKANAPLPPSSPQV